MLNIVDAFTNLPLREIPARVTFTLATRLFFSAEEEGRFSGLIRFVDPDGKELLRSVVQLDVPIFDSDGTGIYIDSVGAVQATLNTTGAFQFEIGKVGDDPAIFPLYVAIKAQS